MSKFLLVDDDKSIISLMSRTLKMAFRDCTVITASTGVEGIEKAAAELPDVILLDVNLPLKDGFEVCREVKSNPRTKRVPIIMISGGRMESSNRILGLELGADSYVFKPYMPEEFVAQVKVMLRIKQAEDLLRSQKESLEQAFQEQTVELQQSQEALKQKVNELENVVERQTEELIRADRLASLGVLAAGIAHEVNNPNTFISSNLQTFKMFWDTIDPLLVSTDALPPDRRQQMEFVRKEMPGLIKGMEEGSRRISSIVSGMKSYASGNVEQHRVIDMAAVVNDALQLVWNQLKHDIDIQNRLKPDLPKVLGSEQLLCQVFVNLFLNAAYAIREYRGEGCLIIEGSVDHENNVVIAVKDNGPGIKPEHMKHLFNPFFTTRQGKGGTGLGLFISHGIIKGHSGRIEVESTLNKGTTVKITIPAIDKNMTVDVDIDNESQGEGSKAVKPENDVVVPAQSKTGHP